MRAYRNCIEPMTVTANGLIVMILPTVLFG